MRPTVIDEKTLNDLAIELVRQPRAPLNELAKSVHISRTTLYRFSRTREELIDRLRKFCASKLGNAAEAASAPSLDTPTAFRLLIEGHLAHKEASAFLLSYWHAPGGPDSVPDPEWTNYELAMERFFVKGQREGAFRADASTICLVDVFSFVVAGMADSALAGRVQSEGLEKILESILLSGMATPLAQYRE